MSSCITYSPVSYAESKWVSAWLPIRYNLSSNKWPVNSFDDTDTITAITDNGGFARIALSSTSLLYLAEEYATISGTGITSYDGVWRIKTVHSPTDITIDAPYSVTGTGSFQRYYNNYTVNVRIYTGIPDGHTLEANNPMALAGEVVLRPDPSNNVSVNIGSYVQAELSPIENKLCEIIQAGDIYGNDPNLWTGFYIAFSESYDISDGTNLSRYTSSYQDDIADDGYSRRIFYASNSTQQFQYAQGKSMGEYAIQDVVAEEFDAKFMTNFAQPTYFEGHEFDTSVIIAYEDWQVSGFDIEYELIEFDSFGATLTTTTTALSYQGEGASFSAGFPAINFFYLVL